MMDPSGHLAWWIIALIVVVGVVAISTTINHIINSENYKNIDTEINEIYTIEEAKNEVDVILKKYNSEAELIFNENDFNIINSFSVTSRYDRQKICEILARTGLSTRESDNMSSEWLGYNLIYSIRNSESTKNANLDYEKDERFYVNFFTKALEILGWE